MQTHSGACGEPPEVEILRSGDDGIYAAWGTLRVRANALELFLRLTDPQENQRIFSNNRTTSVTLNYRQLIKEDEELGTRLFEVSKTGLWRIYGMPFSFESTVFALEDWRNLEIRHCLKNKGAMSHMSGFWRLVPVSEEETLVLFYNEGIPFVPLPWPLKHIGGRVVGRMAFSLLEDLREATLAPISEPRWTAPDRPLWAEMARLRVLGATKA